MGSMLSLLNYIDRPSVSITASPTALGGLPTSNMKVPWFDGIARGSSASYTVSFSWQQDIRIEENIDPGDVTDLVAILGINWRGLFAADLRWWNDGGSYASPAGSLLRSWYGGYPNRWPGRIPRNIFMALPEPTVAKYWRVDVTLGTYLEGAAWAWEARRLWSGPALRFMVSSPLRTKYLGTEAVAIGETAIPSVGDGQAYRRVSFQGRAIPISDIYGPTPSAVNSLHQRMYEKGPDRECIFLPRTEWPTVGDTTQLMGVYGRLDGSLETVQLRGNRFDISGEIVEVPAPLPYPLVPPS